MLEFKVTAISSLHAEFGVPGDKSMSHRAAILGGLSNGPCVIRNFLPSEDCLNTLNAMKALGAPHEVLDELAGYGPLNLRIRGRAMKLDAPGAPIDCGNSGTGMRLLAGLLAGQPFASELYGDASLSSRPMGRITGPLGQMGARIEPRGEKPGCAPLRIEPARLKAITYEMPVASAQVKSAVLLAGLFAEGTTTVIQPVTTRDHTERMLASFRIITRQVGNAISIDGGQVPAGCDFTVPGDISSAAFWLVAAAALPGSRLLVKDVGLNPTRTAILKVLSRMGAHMSEIFHHEEGEPSGNIEIHGAPLKATTILAGEVPNLIDEIPVIAVAAALAEGRTVIRNARELRVKETDRIATVVHNLRAMGAVVEEFDDGMEIDGGHPLRGAQLDSFGDHRIAMAFAIAGLFASGETIIRNTSCVNTSYPGFHHHLDAILQQKSHAADFALPTITTRMKDEG
jgi:3-phosphoshikimate 1-carboxyvinyltransferase